MSGESADGLGFYSTLVREVQELGRALRLVLILDYDGTLVPYAALPSMAVPDPELFDLLAGLCSRPRTRLHLVSGRPREFLEGWFGHLPLGLHAEHGFWSRLEPGDAWLARGSRHQDWKAEVNRLLSSVAKAAPGSFVEEKTASLAWHYRRTPPTVARLALLRAREQLWSLSQGYEIELVEGAMVLEVRPCGFNQGSAVRHVLAADATAGVFAAGDDTMDEDLFSALPAGAFSVAVGGRTKGASHRVASPLELRALLGLLLQ